MFQDDDFKGHIVVLYDSESSLPSLDFNDVLSSFIITGGTWTLYPGTSYQGDPDTLGTGQYSTSSSLVDAGGNNKISSVKKISD